MSRLYLYKLTDIEGTAPCVRGGLLSLAICKPDIRCTAQPGDLVFAVARTTCIAGNLLVYVARVDQALPGRGFYGSPRFAGREDCVYEPHGAGYHLRPVIAIHTKAAAQTPDLGDVPCFRNARVIVCREYAYFDKHGSSDYKLLLPPNRRQN